MSMWQEMRNIDREWRRIQNARALEKQREVHGLESALGRRPDARFLMAVWAAPADAHLRLVYADWLEEHGQTWEATLVRLESRIEALTPDDPQRSGLQRDQDALLADPAHPAGGG